MDNSHIINLNESNFDREVTQHDKPVVVDFWAEWCGPCKMIAPLLDEIAREKLDAVKVAKVNVDENQSLSFKYNIRAIPALLFFQERPTARPSHRRDEQKRFAGPNRSAGLKEIFARAKIPVRSAPGGGRTHNLWLRRPTVYYGA